MTKAMDRLDKAVRKNSPKYNRCKRCGKPHEGGRAVRFQTTIYNTVKDKTPGKKNPFRQKIIWSRARSVCRECAADAVEVALDFLGENK